MLAITTIPIWPGLHDGMIQTTLIEWAKNIPVSLFWKGIAFPIHDSPPLTLRLTYCFGNRFFVGALSTCLAPPEDRVPRFSR